MAQISFEDLVNGVVPDASDFNSRLNALKNRLNNGVEADNIAANAVITAKINAGAVTGAKLGTDAVSAQTLVTAVSTDHVLIADASDSGNVKKCLVSDISDLAPLPVFESALLHVRDVRSSGTNGGACGSGSYNDRTLNTVVTNEISGASLGSNIITLPAGTYFIAGYAVSEVSNAGQKSKIVNTADSTDLVIGTPVYSNVVYNGISAFTTRFTIAAEKTFKLQTRATAENDPYGFGRALSFSDSEIYADIKIWKVA